MSLFVTFCLVSRGSLVRRQDFPDFFFQGTSDFVRKKKSLGEKHRKDKTQNSSYKANSNAVCFLFFVVFYFRRHGGTREDFVRLALSFVLIPPLLLFYTNLEILYSKYTWWTPETLANSRYFCELGSSCALLSWSASLLGIRPRKRHAPGLGFRV